MKNSAFEDSIDTESDRGSTTFDDIGIPTASNIRENQFGLVRTLASINTKEWIFLVSTTCAILASIGFAIYFLIENRDKPTGDFTLALLILLNAVFMLYYVVDGVFTEKAYELLVLVGSIVVVTLYLTANFISTSGWENPVKTARLVIASTLAPLSIILGFCLLFEYFSSGNFIFRKVGADSTLQTLCGRLFVAESVLKFDLQSTLSVILLVVHGGKALNLIETLVISIGVPVSILWLMLGVIAMRMENKMIMAVFLCTSLLQPTYIIFTMVDDARLLRNVTSIIPDRVDFSNAVPAVSFGAGGIALIIRVFLILLSIIVAKNFGKGLKEKVIPPILRQENKHQRLPSQTR